MSKFCMNCGKALDEGARFCGACGTPCAAQPAPAEPEAPYTQASPFGQAEQQAAAGFYQQQNNNSFGYADQGGQQSYQQYGGGYQQNTSANSAQYGQPDQANTLQYGQPIQSNTPQYGQPVQNNTQQYGQQGQTNTQQYGQPQPQPYGTNPQPAGYGQTAKKSKAPLFIILGVAGVAIIAIVAIFAFKLLGGSSGPEGVMDQFIRYAFTSERSAEKVAPLFFEYDYSKYSDHKEDVDSDLEDTLGDGNGSIDSYLREEFGDDYTVTYEFTYKETLSGDDYDHAIEYFSDCYTDDVEEIVYAEINLIIKGSIDSHESELELYFVKAKGKWYVEEALFY